jgi:DNA-binding Xre family transcriptional regulator
MKTKDKTAFDRFVKSLSPKEKKEFDQEYKELLISEMLLAAMEEDNVSVRKLAKLAGISPTIVQGIRSGTKQNVTIKTFFKLMNSLGYSLIAEKGKTRLVLDIL